MQEPALAEPPDGQRAGVGAGRARSRRAAPRPDRTGWISRLIAARARTVIRPIAPCRPRAEADRTTARARMARTPDRSHGRRSPKILTVWSAADIDRRVASPVASSRRRLQHRRERADRRARPSWRPARHGDVEHSVRPRPATSRVSRGRRKVVDEQPPAQVAQRRSQIDARRRSRRAGSRSNDQDSTAAVDGATVRRSAQAIARPSASADRERVHRRAPAPRGPAAPPRPSPCALATATCRAVCEKPQSGVTETRSASTYFRTVRSRSATRSGGSTQVFLTSTSPTATSIVSGNSRQQLDLGHLAAGELQGELIDLRPADVREQRPRTTASRRPAPGSCRSTCAC